MNRQKWILLLVLAAVAAVVIWLAVGQRTPPFLPSDEEHAVFTGADDCLPCHDLEGPAARSINHPVGRDCLRCHGIRK